MGKLDGYSATEKRQITSLAARLVEGDIESGKIACTEEAIKAAMPEAFSTAIACVNAVNEYLSG